MPSGNYEPASKEAEMLARNPFPAREEEEDLSFQLWPAVLGEGEGFCNGQFVSGMLEKERTLAVAFATFQRDSPRGGISLGRPYPKREASAFNGCPSVNTERTNAFRDFSPFPPLFPPPVAFSASRGESH